MEIDPIYVPDDDFIRVVLTFLTTEKAQETGGPSDHTDDGSASDVPTTPSIEELTRKPRKPIPRDSNRSRLERRYEVWSLREQVVALEAHLRELQQRAEVHGLPEAQTCSTDSTALAWQAVATCQRNRLLLVEKERKKRRKWLRKYTNTFKRAEKMLTMTPFPTADGIRPFTSSLVFDGVDGFEDISRHVSTMYLQRHGVFNDLRFHASIHGIQDFRVQNEATAHMSFEVLESRLFPFTSHAIATAIWRYHQVNAKRIVHDVEVNLAQTDNIIRRKFVLLMDMPHRKFQALGRIEIRRFVEEDRVVFLQHAVFDQTKRINGMVPDGYVVRQFQWTVIGPPRNEDLRVSGRDVCQVERFEVLIPVKICSRNQDLRSDQAALKQIVLETTNRVHENERDVVESILLNAPLTVS